MQVGTIVWHVAAHEIGHAIYGLDGVKDVIKTSTKTLLEEPRAELTALHTMTLLEPAGMLSKVCCQPTLLPGLFRTGLLPPLVFLWQTQRRRILSPNCMARLVAGAHGRLFSYCLGAARGTSMR